MKSLLIITLFALSGFTVAQAAPPPGIETDPAVAPADPNVPPIDTAPDAADPSAPKAAFSIMFEATIDMATGHWTAGQAVAGFPSYDACDAAVPKAADLVQLSLLKPLKPTEQMIFFCPHIDIDGIKKEQEHAQKEDPDPKPPLDLDTREPATTL